MKLYYNPISTYSQKVLIALYEKGLDFEPEIVNLMDADARARYRDVNPLGKIPCLQLDDGHIIPESSIIIEYIDPLAEPTLIKGNANGEEFLMSDCAAAPALYYAEQVVPFAEHKNISAYWERLKSRPSVQRTHEEAAPILEAMFTKDAA